MKILDITEKEAIQLWLDDNGITVNKEQEELDNKAKNVKIDHGASAEVKKERKPKEKKENPTKKAIISVLINALQGELNTLKQMDMITNQISSINVRNDEKYIDFTLNNINYTINLVAHRVKK